MASPVLATFNGTTYALEAAPGLTAAAICAAVLSRACAVPPDVAPWHALCVTQRGLVVARDASVNSGSCVSVQARGGLPGGKGGFGANLRQSGHKSVRSSTRNFNACRDLQGRRLKAVNDELRLRKWLSPEEEERRAKLLPMGEYTEARGDSGLQAWFLPVPAWADGMGHGGSDAKRAGQQDRRSVKRKTSLCRDWQEARRSRDAPEGAPRWWGCSRGPRCEFAHGEEELRMEAKLAAAEAARDRARSTFDAHQQAYTAGMYLYTNDATDGDDSGGKRSMLTSVVEGMRAAAAAAGQKRRRPAPAEDEEEDAPDAADAFRRAPRMAAEAAPPISQARAAAAAVPIVRAAEHASLQQEWNAASWLYAVTGDDGVGDAAALVSYLSHVVSSMQEAAAHSFTSSSSSSLVAAVSSRQAPVSNVAEVTGSAPFATVAALSAPLRVTAASPHVAAYYEVELISDGVVQLGWLRDGFSVHAADEGVGDDACSWGYDGSRRVKLHAEHDDEYGQDWEEGDVIGCLLDMRRDEDAAVTMTCTMTFFQNGDNVGRAFTAVLAVDAVLYAAVSIEAGEVVRINLGQAGLAYAPAPSLYPGVMSIAALNARQKRARDVAAPSPPAKAAPTAATAVAALDPTPAVATAVAEDGTRTATAAAPVPHPPISLTSATTLEELQPLSLDDLKRELTSRGLKAGGTWLERAERLLAVRGMVADQVPTKLRGTGFPGPAMPRS